MEIHPSIQSDIGPLIDELQSKGFVVKTAYYDPACFGNCIVELGNGHILIRMIRDRRVWELDGTKALYEKFSLWKGFHLPQEFCAQVLQSVDALIHG